MTGVQLDVDANVCFTNANSRRVRLLKDKHVNHALKACYGDEGLGVMLPPKDEAAIAGLVALAEQAGYGAAS